MRRPMTTLLAALAASAAALGMAGCRGERTDKPPRQFFPDMDDQPRFEPQMATEFFADGRSMRPSVPGTIGYGRSPIDVSDPAIAETSWAQRASVERARLIKEDDAVYFGTTGLGESGESPEAWIDTIPIPVTRELIELGRKNFNIYCATCHGYEGDGKGPVGIRWSVPVANFYDEKYRDQSQFTGRDGYIFHVGRNGLYGPEGNLRMPGYKHALNEEEAWGVVAYIRALQEARGVSIDDDIVPDAERQRLLESNRSLSDGAGTTQNDTGPELAEGGTR
ncbi:MAG: cytochrome c [Planctomycetota bacterium]